MAANSYVEEVSIDIHGVEKVVDYAHSGQVPYYGYEGGEQRTRDNHEQWQRLLHRRGDETRVEVVKVTWLHRAICTSYVTRYACNIDAATVWHPQMHGHLRNYIKKVIAHCEKHKLYESGPYGPFVVCIGCDNRRWFLLCVNICSQTSQLKPATIPIL